MRDNHHQYNRHQSNRQQNNRHQNNNALLATQVHKRIIGTIQKERMFKFLGLFFLVISWAGSYDIQFQPPTESPEVWPLITFCIAIVLFFIGYRQSQKGCPGADT